MRNNIRPYIFALLILTVTCVGAQTPEIDSLKKELKKCTVDSCRMDLLYELSKVQSSQMETSAGLKSAKMAEVLAKKMNSKKGLAKAYHAIGNVYIQEGNYAEALEFHLKALQIKDELNDQQGLAASYNNLGHIYHSINNYDMAMTYYQRSIDVKNNLLKEAEKNDDQKEITRLLLSLATTSNSMGTNLDELGRHEEAIGYYTNAITIHERFNNFRGKAGCLENMGVAYFMMRNFKKALEYFNQVYKIRKGHDDTILLAGTYLNLGKANLFNRNFKMAEQFLNNALRLSQIVRMTDVTRDSYRGLYELENDKKNYTLALFHFKRYIKYRDSITNDEVTKRMTRLQLNHDFDKKEKEEQLIQEKKDAITKQKSEFQMVIIISMCVLFLIIIGFVIYAAINYSHKKKINKLITKQKEIIEEKQNEIIASIKYAKRIQSILITSESYIDKEIKRLNKN